LKRASISSPKTAPSQPRFVGGTRRPIAEESAFFEEEIRVLIADPYRVLYRIAGDEVQVLHVRHGARQRETAG